MDIIEFAEARYRCELPEWQKNYIRMLYEMGKDAKIYICMPPHSGRTQALIHINNVKELLSNGAQNDRK